jgi:hypothetical protein
MCRYLSKTVVSVFARLPGSLLPDNRQQVGVSGGLYVRQPQDHIDLCFRDSSQTLTSGSYVKSTGKRRDDNRNKTVHYT